MTSFDSLIVTNHEPGVDRPVERRESIDSNCSSRPTPPLPTLLSPEGCAGIEALDSVERDIGVGHDRPIERSDPFPATYHGGRGNL